MTLYEQEIYGAVSKIGDVVKKDITVRQDIRDAYRVELNDKRGKIHELVFAATIKVIPSDAPLAYCVSYDGGRHIVAHWDKGEGHDNFTVILTKKNDEEWEQTQ